MRTQWNVSGATGTVRSPAVAGSFYPAGPDRLRRLVEGLLDEAGRDATAASSGAAWTTRSLQGLLVPHAGLVFSGLVAAAGWRLLGLDAVDRPAATTVILLGTNHGAAWLDGVGVWDAGAWRTPLGSSAVDEDLAAAILGLGAPFTVDRAAHLGEHSIEVQLPLLQAVAPETRIVPLAVGTGTGLGAVATGEALGELLAARRSAGDRLVLAISSDMAHYPVHDVCAQVTATLLPHLLEVDAAALARAERTVLDADVPQLVCGMCGIAPAVVGLAALRAMGVTHGVPLAHATSADAGGPAERTVGYLAVAY